MGHILFKCDKFLKMQPEQRHIHAEQLRLCFNCLQAFTKDLTCSKRTCGHGHTKHHTVTHWQTETTNDKKSTTSSNQSLSADINTYCSFEGKPNNRIFLATAAVGVKNKFGQYIPCTALLDSANQAHFITESCVHLRLRRAPTYASIQGIGNANTSTYDSVSIHLRSKNTEWHTTLHCAISDKITRTTPPTKLDTTHWKPPKDIKLADEQFDQPGRIGLLLWADIYEILRSGRRTRSGNFPVLQEHNSAGRFLVELQHAHRVIHPSKKQVPH
jgi:hypothetical protein